MITQTVKSFIRKLVVTVVIATFVVVPVSEAKAAEVVNSCPKYEKLLRKHKLPVKTFTRIMWRESKCEPKAIGWNYYKGKSHLDCKLSHARTYRRCKAVKSYDVGLLQINSSWKSLTAKVCKYKYGKMLVLQRVDCNLKVASHLYRNGGMVHWAGNSIKK
jgi:hypothetical protein